MPGSRQTTDEATEARRGRPLPDEAQLDDEQPGVTDLDPRDYGAIVKRAGKAALDHEITDAAAAIAYYAFLAIPAMLLISVGVFSIFAGPSAIETVINRLGSVMPAEAVTLL